MAYATDKPAQGFIYYWDYEARQWVVTKNGVIVNYFNTAIEAKEFCDQQSAEGGYKVIANNKHS